MRTLLKVRIPVEGGNRAIKDGTLPTVVGKFVETWKPEAAYFAAEEGCRCAYFVLDVKNSQDLPSIAEPFFMEFDAEIFTSICMNLEDLQKGVEKAAQNR
jgi:hypothetical protein